MLPFLLLLKQQNYFTQIALMKQILQISPRHLLALSRRKGYQLTNSNHIGFGNQSI